MSLPGSNFEIDTDANLRVDDPSPSIDWANVTETRKPELFIGAQDESFGQGTKEDTAVPTVVDGSIPPNKSDLLTFGVFLEENAGTSFLNVYWHRVQEPQGTTNMDFEFNKSDQLSDNGVTPERTSGDVLIQYDLAQGGTNPQLFVSRWIDGTEGATAADCEASNRLPCWDARENLSAAGDAAGSINTSTIPAAESDGLGSMSPRTFGEAQIDFDALTGGSDECVAFGSAYLKSRSSDSFTAALKDFIPPANVDLGRCGGVEVIKLDDAAPPNSLDGAVFNLLADNDPIGGSPGPEDTFVSTCTTVGGTCSLGDNDIVEGEYWVVEITAPPGHDLPDPAFQHVTVVADTTVTVTFIDPRQRGAIEITKTRKHAAAGAGDHPHAGVTFTVSGGSLSTPVDVVTDANGQACVDDLLFGDYTVTETVPAGYVADGPTSKSVTVNTKADCGANRAAAADVGFSNTPLTDITVTVDSQIDGGTASTINCGAGSVSTGPNGDGSTSRTNLPPGTYTCTIVIDP